MLIDDMTDWKTAIEDNIALYQGSGSRQISICNEEWYQEGCDRLLLQAFHPQAGSIAYNYRSGCYTVSNEHTFATFSDLLEDEVVPALLALDVSNSLWY